MQKLMGHMRAAMDKYNMIEQGDTVAVGVSGGKDSLVLLCAMKLLSTYYPKKFTVKGIAVDPCFNNIPTDYTEIIRLCDKIGAELIIRRTELGDIIFNRRKETNPCSLCARMRRGILHDMCKEHGCNKLALGHHMDDAVETFFMNIFNGGNIASFSPVTYLSRKDLYLIRPMVFCEERMISNLSVRMNLPVTKSKCPADGVTERQNFKEQITAWEKTYPDIKAKIIGAMQRSNISGW